MNAATFQGNSNELTREQKRAWLISHGYIAMVDGIECLSAQAISALMGFAYRSDELKQMAAGKDAIPVTPKMIEGAKQVKKAAGTNDMVEILYACFAEKGVRDE